MSDNTHPLHAEIESLAAEKTARYRRLHREQCSDAYGLVRSLEEYLKGELQTEAAGMVDPETFAHQAEQRAALLAAARAWLAGQ